MTREEFIRDAESLGYEQNVINEILKACDEMMADAPAEFVFDYGTLPLFEQPKGDI